MSDTEGMLLFWLATFDQWTMSQFRFPVIKGVVIVSHAFFFFRKAKTCYYPSLRRFFQMMIKGTKESVVVEAIKMVKCFAPIC